MKINSAAQLGGPELVKQTLLDLTGIQANHFVMVDFNGFKDMVDAIGGVYINVPTRIFDPEAANHDYTAELILPGYKKLDGKHALTFVRARKGFAQGDFQRIENQQAFIKALAKQTLQIQNLFRANAIVDAVVKNVTTDMKLNELMDLATQFRGNGTSIEATTIPSYPKYIGGVAYVITDKAKVQALFARVQNGESIESTAAAGSSATSGAVGATAPAGAADTTVIVRNGTTTTGVAKTAAAKLTSKGFQIKEVGNAQRKVYDQTLIVYKTDPTKAQLVADDLGYGRLVQSLGRYSFNTDVLVVVGADYKK